MSTQNLLILAADHPSKVLQALRQSSSLASLQDENGYSLLHAAASYNHLEFLRSLVKEFNANVNIKDEDGETPLFVVETLECAQLLVEELRADITIKNSDGKTALEKISEEADFPNVVTYLRAKELESDGMTSQAAEILDKASRGCLPPPPEGITIDIGTMSPECAGDVMDLDFKRRIEALASRADFEAESGQDTLRELVKDALRSQEVDRNTRQRMI